jgi:hypothetical protein
MMRFKTQPDTRDEQILELLGQGMTTLQVAQAMYLSHNTVRKRVLRLREFIGRTTGKPCSNLFQLGMWHASR